MAFVTLNDGIHLLDGVIFPNQFKKYELDISEEQIYVVQGKFDKRNGKTQLIINDIYTEEAFESLKLNQTKQIIVRKVDQVEGFYQYLDQENIDQSIEVLSFNDQTNEMSRLGYIKKNSAFLTDLVKLFKLLSRIEL